MPAGVRKIGLRQPLPPGTTVVAPVSQQAILFDIDTETVTRNGQVVYDTWDAQLYNGEGTMGGGSTGRPSGSLEIASGELYIHGTFVGAALPMIAPPFPVVITKGTVKAGSLGASWCVMADSQTTWIALVSTPHATHHGAVEVKDVDNHGQILTAAITSVDHYLELPGHRLPANAQETSLTSNTALRNRVVDMLRRAKEIRLRPR